MVGPADRARRVRHRQSEEVHRAGRRCRRPAQQHDRHRTGDPRPRDPRTQGTGGVVAQRQRVERPGEQQGNHQPGEDERRCRLQLRAPATAQRPDRPEVVLLQQLGVGEDDAVDDRRQRRADRGAREREPHRRRAPAAGGADPVDHDRGDRRTEEGEPDRAGRAGEPKRQRDHDRGRGARVDAEQAGVRERVAGQRLHQRARDADRRAHGDAEHRPRDPQVADDRRLLRVAAVQQRVEGVLQRDRARAHGQAEQRGEGEDGDGHAESGAPRQNGRSARPASCR